MKNLSPCNDQWLQVCQKQTAKCVFEILDQCKRCVVATYIKKGMHNACVTSVI